MKVEEVGAACVAAICTALTSLFICQQKRSFLLGGRAVNCYGW